MGKKPRRAHVRAATSLVMAGAIGFGLPTSAFADPVIKGSCANTLQSEGAQARALAADEEPLTVDVGAAVGAPGQLDVGLGSDSASNSTSQGEQQTQGAGTTGTEDTASTERAATTESTESAETTENRAAAEEDTPLVSAPVADTVKTLGVGDNPVGTMAARGCDVVQDVGNAAGETTAGVLSLGGDNQEEPPSDTPPGPNPPGDQPGGPGPGEPAPGPGPAPEEPGAQPGTAPTTPGVGAPGSSDALYPGGAIAYPPGLNATPPLTPPMIPPGGPPVQAPDLGTPGENQPDVRAQDSGTAEPMQAGADSNRLPSLLAIIALAVAVAALVRAWTRKNKAA